MTAVWTIARKEFRGFFSSPVAFVFLAVTLAVTFVNFFQVADFFATNTADVRPLFAAMPWVLIILVAALTMRLWSEEQKTGTLEVLMTLPVGHRDLVLGKFFAGLGLVALALAFTVGLPVTAGLLGPLDLGPVLGGYFASLLLGGTYLALGLCISSLTDNQIVSLILTLSVGLLFVVVGQEDISRYVGSQLGDLVGHVWEGRGKGVGLGVTSLMESLGTTSRFENIQRGLLDSRDVVFFLSLTVFFLVLNGQMILAKRQLPRESRDESDRSTLVLLLAANVILLNLWMAPRALFRLDLTEDRIYSLSPITRTLITELEEELTLGVYASRETHELIKPLVPELQDFANEYAELAEGRIHLEVLDPGEDEALAARLRSRYNIEPITVPIRVKRGEGYVQAYFHVVVAYGDRHEVLELQDIVELPPRTDPVTGQPLIKFNNLEYDLTRTIKRVVHDFQSLESAFARFDGGAQLTFWFGKDAFQEDPETLAALEEFVLRTEQAVEPLIQMSRGKFNFRVIDPIAEKMDIRMLQKEGLNVLQLYTGQVFALQLNVQGRRELIPVESNPGPEELRQRIETVLRRHLPGFSKTIGLWTGDPVTPPDPRGMAPPPRSSYGLVQEILGRDYTVRIIDQEILSGRVPHDIDALVVLGLGEDVPEVAQWAFDQYAMAGKPVVLCQGVADVGLAPQSLRTSVKARINGLNQLMESYGLQVFYRMVQSDTCGATLQGTQRAPALRDRDPSVLVLGGPAILEHPATAGLTSLILPWASPVNFDRRREGAIYTTLLQTDEKTWLHTPQAVEDGNPSGSFEGAQTLAGIVEGAADSFFKDKPAPLRSDGTAVTEDKTVARLNGTGDLRVAVIGSHAAFQEFPLQIFQSTEQIRPGQTDAWFNNFVLLQNLISWGLGEGELTALRGRGHNARLLTTLEEDEMNLIELTNYGVAALLLGLVLAGHFVMRRGSKPMVDVGSAA